MRVAGSKTSPCDLTFHCLVGSRVSKPQSRDFPGGAVVKNLPANAGDMGLIPGPGRSHMPWSN